MNYVYIMPSVAFAPVETVPDKPLDSPVSINIIKIIGITIDAELMARKACFFISNATI